MRFNQRELSVLVVALSYCLSNVDDVNEAMQSLDSEETITFSGYGCQPRTIYAITEKEISELRDKCQYVLS